MTAADMLVAALRTKAGAAFQHRIATTPWHSAGLAGERHELALRFDDRAIADRLLAGLADYDFDMREGFVADIVAGSPVADGDAVGVAIEALILEA